MRRVLIAALLCGVSSTAFADAPRFECNMTDTKGNLLYYSFVMSGITYLTETSMTRNGVSQSDGKTHGWTIANYDSQLSSDWTYDDDPSYAIAAPWSGRGNDKKAALWHKYNGHTTLMADGECHHIKDAPAQAAPAPKQYVPPVARSTPSSSQDSVAFTLTENQQIMVKVTMGGLLVDMQLDTGANLASIGEDLADKLIAGGYATEGERGDVELADGSTVSQRRIVVTKVSIGKHTVANMRAGVVKDGKEMLLSLPVLNAIGKFTIDSANQRLTFN